MFEFAILCRRPSSCSCSNRKSTSFDKDPKIYKGDGGDGQALLADFPSNGSGMLPRLIYCYCTSLYICIIMGNGMLLTWSYLYLAGDTDFN